MQVQRNTEIAWLSNTTCRIAILFAVMTTLIFFSINAHAAEAVDVLANTMGSATATLNGTGKKWIILIDFLVSAGAFAYTKKPLVFFSSFAILVAISAIGTLIQ